MGGTSLRPTYAYRFARVGMNGSRGKGSAVMPEQQQKDAVKETVRSQETRFALFFHDK